MPPIPEDRVSHDVSPVTDERIVISGMSGLYPNSHHVQELANILYNKANPISTENCRWDYNHPEVAQLTGKVPGLSQFDGQFFKVHYRLGHTMDAMSRKMLEQAYQAIYDSGMNPVHLSGKMVGVYIGTCISETEKTCFYESSARSGFGIAGCSKAMFANRVSYWLNAKGPSMSMDNGCCSSSSALEQAYLAISRGECEAAIVGGANLCLHPQSTIHYSRIMKLSMDGKTKSFDQHADGCAKSEAICVFFLQKAKDALRIYAEVVNIENQFTGIMEDANGPKYGPYRDSVKMASFIKNFYEKTGISPSAVEYVEAFGSATPEADKAELEALDAVFCENREDHLMVGSVMSNIGYCEAASGIAAITKVLLGYHKGEIAANLNYETPRQDVKGLCDGRMRIVGEHEKFRRTYAAVNTLSVTGVTCHVLLHGSYKPKDLNRYKSSIPRLVTVTGRQETSVKNLFEELKSKPVDPEQLALLSNVHSAAISGHLGRGFVILDTNAENETVSLCEKVDYFDDVKRPLCFVYSGMGSQWPEMGAQLMRIPIFAAAIERCHRVLEHKGIDIVKIITTPDKNIFDNILHSFVGIAAVQIGLTDILQAVGLVPDTIIGHSVGELGCAYADGCFTAEEMILAAYYRGLVSVQTPFIRGSMAAIGIGYQKIKALCPPEIEVACHNGPDSCTISGPAEVMKTFVEQLTAKSIFAKEVPCSNIAYHSRYISEAGPALLKNLCDAIKEPKERSKRWLSTSVPENKWNEPAAKYSSAQYHTNNLLNPVLFEETSRLISTNAVLVEIAPHGLLQAILKRSLPDTCHNIPLTKRGHDDNACFVLEALGKLHMEGFILKIDALYPKVEFPVSTGTPFLSNLVGWEHSEKWRLPLYATANRAKATACNFIISIHDDEHSYLKGIVIRGKTLYPYAAALVAAWDTLAMWTGHPKKQLSVQFSDVLLYAQPILHDRKKLRISVTFQRGTGMFEIMDTDSKVATGFLVAKIPNKKHSVIKETENTQEIILKSDDVYKLLSEKDYLYGGAFRSIQNVNESLTKAHVQWNDNWVTLIDALLQLSILKNHNDGVFEPNSIRSMGINVREHPNKQFITVEGKNVLEVHIDSVTDSISCAGVTLDTVLFRNISMKENDVILKSLQFIPLHSTDKMDVTSTLHVFLQMIAENTHKNLIKIVEVIYHDKSTVLSKITEIDKDLSGSQFVCKQVNLKTLLNEHEHILSDVDVVLIKNLSDNNITNILHRSLDRNAFLINFEDTDIPQIQRTKLYNVLSSHTSGKNRLSLIRWKSENSTIDTTTISIRTHSDLAILSTTRATLTSKNKLVILANYSITPGLKELVTCWRQDSNCNQVFLITTSNDVVNENLDQILELGLAFNTLKEGIWGSEYYIPWNENLQEVKHGVTLRSKKRGYINSINWVELPKSDEPGIPVTVHYAGLSIHDAKQATGVNNNENETSDSYGVDFSGITDSGERVMGLVPGGAASTRIHALPELLWPVPEHWTLEDAATIPLAYVEALYCLIIKCKLYPGMSILVHGGAGALGQAVISIALSYNCNVFTTVSNNDKKLFLLGLFPTLEEDHIGNSRCSSFGDMVMSLTKGQGCDILISCVSEELKNTTLHCCGFAGITFDFSQLSNRDNYTFGMSNLMRQRSYCTINFSSLFSKENKMHLKHIQRVISEGIALGTVRPLSRMTFAPQDAARALRLLATSRHRGRVLLHLQDFQLSAQPRIKCTSNQWHVVICQDDFGLQWIERLVDRGVRRLRLNISEVSNYTLYKAQLWRQKGVEVKITCEDMSQTKVILLFFNDFTETSSIEGIYLTATISNPKIVEKLVASLDSMSRKLCQNLKYFAVVSTDNTAGQITCLSRAWDRLPATKVILSSSRDKRGMTSISLRSAVDIMERALCSSPNIVMAGPQKVKSSLLTQISDIAGIEIPQGIDDTTNLQSLGVQYEKVLAISNYLRNMYSICYDNEKIASLSVKEINYLEELATKSDFEDSKVKGLRTFYSYVDSDELLATTDLVLVPTLTNISSKRCDEFDVNQKYLCIIPGLEGNYKRFTQICEQLKIHALVLQPGLDNLQETIPQMAERYVKIILKTLATQSTFYLLGYECGVMVALEIANILEEQGLTGTVYCVGAWPDELKAVVENVASDYTTEEFQDAVAHHIFTLMKGDSTPEKKIDFQKYSTWKEKIEAYARTLLGQIACSTQYARSRIESAFLQIERVRNYKPNPKPLRSKIVMLRASGIDISKHSEIQQYSQHPVITYKLEAPLTYASEDLRCACIINRHLDDDIIQAYNEKNECESYLINPGTFISFE